MRRTYPLPLVLTGLLVAGAAGAQYDPPGGGTPGPQGCAGVEHVVRLNSDTLTFEPPTLVIAAGKQVCWTWGGGHSHNVRANDGSFNSGTPAASGSFQVTFGAAGSFPYHCQTHGSASSGMRGTIVVQGSDGGGDPGGEAGPGTFAPVGPAEVREDAGAVTITVERNDGNEGKATLRFTVAGGSARINKDFRKVAGVLRWDDGQGGPQSFSVPILNDGELELPETFTVKLSKPTPRGAALAASTVTVTLVDDDFSCEAAASLSAPASLAATGHSPREVRLSWGREPAAAATVRVERARFGEPFREVAAVASGLRGFVDGALDPGTTYLYRLRADGLGGLSTYGEAVAAATDGSTAPCAAGALCLAGGRFEATLEWRVAGVEPARRGRAVALGDAADSGLFALIAGQEPELLLGVADGCAANGHFWVSLAGVTEGELLVKVRDTATGRTWAHFNPEGSTAALRDVDALAVCP